MQEEAYFTSTPRPPTIDSRISLVEEFINNQVTNTSKIVLITSGGTTVPLELNTVRFIDNFSLGMFSFGLLVIRRMIQGQEAL